jgi:hypothetical protein
MCLTGAHAAVAAPARPPGASLRGDRRITPFGSLRWKLNPAVAGHDRFISRTTLLRGPVESGLTAPI